MFLLKKNIIQSNFNKLNILGIKKKIIFYFYFLLLKKLNFIVKKYKLKSSNVGIILTFKKSNFIINILYKLNLLLKYSLGEVLVLFNTLSLRKTNLKYKLILFELVFYLLKSRRQLNINFFIIKNLKKEFLFLIKFLNSKDLQINFLLFKNKEVYVNRKMKKIRNVKRKIKKKIKFFY